MLPRCAPSPPRPVSNEMSEGVIRFSAQHTPSDDPFETVTLSAIVHQVGGFGGVQVHKEVGTDEARAFAAQIIAACEIVERDADPLSRTEKRDA